MPDDSLPIDDHSFTHEPGDEPGSAQRQYTADILESISDAFYAVDHEWTFTYVNCRAEEIWGIPREDLLGQNLWEVFPHSVGGRVHQELQSAAETRRSVEFELLSPVMQRWLEISVYPGRSGLSVYFRDITARKTAQDAVMQHQAEIDALNLKLQRAMSETHHRVKNNLQVVAALLDMQLMQYDQAVPVSEVDRLRRHVMSLSTIHDLLTYQARKDADVYDVSIKDAMDKFIPLLQGMIVGRTIHLQVEDTRIPVGQCTAFTVLANELVSNAAKHGAGDIRLDFSIRSGRAIFEVCDSGPGFSSGFDPAIAANAGLDLAMTLARLDLQGEIRFGNQEDGGACVIVEFPLPDHAHATGER
jgi:PAS domain S-box-containing protein